MQFSKHRNRNQIEKSKHPVSSSSPGVSALVMSVVRVGWPDFFELIGRQPYAEQLSAKNTKPRLHFARFTIIGQQKIRKMVYSSSLQATRSQPSRVPLGCGGRGNLDEQMINLQQLWDAIMSIWIISGEYFQHNVKSVQWGIMGVLKAIGLFVCN